MECIVSQINLSFSLVLAQDNFFAVSIKTFNFIPQYFVLSQSSF
jgi:hypothetical protein